MLTLQKLIQHPLAQANPPVWADSWGEDKYGIWAGFTYKDVFQRCRWIRPGAFMMGSPKSEEGRWDDERLHRVILNKGFWIADTACTQALWKAVVGENPSNFKGEKKPVEHVSWKDCREFMATLNGEISGLNLDFPTEAQWEYACRAGTDTPYSFKGKISKKLVNYESDETVDVAALPPNSWGLYEMHGNVWEWCRDYWRGQIREEETDPKGPLKGSGRGFRGGSWFSSARYVRSAYRSRFGPDYRGRDLGFRFAPGQAE